MINPILRPGYTALAGARNLALDSDGWLLLTEDVLRLPLSMLSAVRRTVRKGAWRYANDPLNSVRENSERDYRREAIRNEEAAAGPRVFGRNTGIGPFTSTISREFKGSFRPLRER
jgi:hypothetical protein